MCLAEFVNQQKDSAILVTHSVDGTIGWRTAIRTDKVRVIIAYEPGGIPFVFPETEMPKITDARFKALSASVMGVPMSDFLKLTKIPIVLYYGDYIQIGSENVGEDKWGAEYSMAEQFVAAINRHSGELFEIDTVKNYPVDYTECTQVSKIEIQQKTRLELKRYLASLDDYDKIFLGYPIWWSVPPMAISIFLEHYDFSGKKIFPFVTHEGSGSTSRRLTFTISIELTQKLSRKQSPLSWTN